MSAREPLLVLPSAEPEKRSGDGVRQPLPLHMRIVTLLYGDSTSDDALVHAGFYALLMCAIVGVYWLLRSLKDSVFATVVGLEYQPIAKMSSLVVVTVLLLLYNKGVDLLAGKSPQRSGVGAPLFAAVFSCYAAVFLAVAAGLGSTQYGLYGPSGEPLSPSPYRLLGWVFYFAIESYGTLSVSLFWQFVNSQVGVKAAKSQYGIIVAGGQVGAIGGCTIVISCRSLGVPRLAGLGALLTLLPVLLLRRCSRGSGTDAAPHSPHDSQQSRSSRVKPGLLEGARLVFAHRYVTALCISTSLYKVMATIMDYQMQVLVRAEQSTADGYAAFMGLFGVATNTVSLLFSLLGTSCTLRTLGLRTTLVSYPLCLAAVSIAILFRPDVWVMFYLQTAAKGLSYALQSPSRELLYIITTDSIKFKAKSWIDVFGGHAAKAAGSAINHACKHSFELVMTAGSLTSLGVAIALALLGSWLGRRFEASSASDELIGEDDGTIPLGPVTSSSAKWGGLALHPLEGDGHGLQRGRERAV